MRRSNPRLLTMLTLVACVIAGPTIDTAAAQERPAPAAELAAGALLFADDGVVTEAFVGAAGRFHVLPRVSVGPEFAFIQGENHSHLMLTGNVTFDFVPPINGRPPQVTPFVVAGLGLFHTRESFPNNQTFAHNEGAFTAGAGVMGRVGERVTVGAEVRVGWELHIRLNGTIGVRLGR